MALAHLLEDALREQRRQDDDDRTERGGERDESPLETCEDDDVVSL
jgi:hypothetical protein